MGSFALGGLDGGKPQSITSIVRIWRVVTVAFTTMWPIRQDLLLCLYGGALLGGFHCCGLMVGVAYISLSHCAPGFASDIRSVASFESPALNTLLISHRPVVRHLIPRSCGPTGDYHRTTRYFALSVASPAANRS